jgi:pyruvate/2-oxoglutarate dehydrogenase complex dihydrolipoamide dehydrogenase (E3) component
VEAALAAGGTRALTGERVVVNTGTRPSEPNIPGLAAAHALNSESIQELGRVPEHLVVLGGGYIGLEFAQMFRRFGSRVTVIERNPQFLPREDADVAEHVLAVFRDDGIEVLTAAATTRVEGRSGDAIRVTVTTPTGERTIEGTDLLVALGRVPNTEGLNAAAAGVELDPRNFVKVNDRLETTAAGVYAVGDVNGGPQFTHVSFDDYRILKANLAGGNRSTAGRVVPYSLFIDPELGRVGLTEADARKQGFKVKVATLPAAAIPRAKTTGETRGFLKAVVDAATGRILGAAVFAAEGGEIIAAVQMAMLAGLPATAVRDAVFAHPTMTEGLGDLFARLG